MVNKKSFGAIFAVFLLLSIELILHTDAFLLKYRSVFAAGRAMDKLHTISELPIELLLIGNSRVDNGFDPFIFKEKLNLNTFNLGVPGANAEILYGMVLRLSRNGMLQPGNINKVLIGLDESIFQSDDSLGYSVFFSNRYELLKQNEFGRLFSSVFRLRGYGPQLKELREPEKFFRFIKATFNDIPPVGGAAKINLGFRTGERGKFQNDQQLLRQEVGTINPPDPISIEYFWKLINLLTEKHIKVAIFFPPLLNRETLFLDSENTYSSPYINIKDLLVLKKVPIIKLEVRNKDVTEFANAGHLNIEGSKHYTRLIIQEVNKIWPNLKGT